MKHILFKQLPVFIFACTMLSCAKNGGIKPSGTASLSLINALPASTPYLLPNFSGTDPLTWYSKALKLTYATIDKNALAMAYGGEQKLAIYRYPDTLAKSTPLYNLVLNLQRGSSYTLFLTGTLAAPDTMFTTDVIPFHPATDSVMGVRFVNLSAGSGPVNISITGATTGPAVSNLAYKSMTGFIMFPATSTVSNYNFEVRDAATNLLLGSYNATGINLPTGANGKRFRNFTLAYMASPTDATTRKTMFIDTYTPN